MQKADWGPHSPFLRTLDTTGRKVRLYSEGVQLYAVGLYAGAVRLYDKGMCLYAEELGYIVQ
jgi:hypothetical protein